MSYSTAASKAPAEGAPLPPPLPPAPHTHHPRPLAPLSIPAPAPCIAPGSPSNVLRSPISSVLESGPGIAALYLGEREKPSSAPRRTAIKPVAVHRGAVIHRASPLCKEAAPLDSRTASPPPAALLPAEARPHGASASSGGSGTLIRRALAQRQAKTAASVVPGLLPPPPPPLPPPTAAAILPTEDVPEPWTDDVLGLSTKDPGLAPAVLVAGPRRRRGGHSLSPVGRTSASPTQPVTVHSPSPLLARKAEGNEEGEEAGEEKGSSGGAVAATGGGCGGP